MNGPTAPNRFAALDAMPAGLFVAVSLLVLFTVPHIRPERLIVDRWRYYVVAGVVTILAWAVIGYLVLHLVGGRRPLMTVLTLSSLPILPVAIVALLGWLNAALDHAPVSDLTLRVSGFTHHGRTGLIGVRFDSPETPFPRVEAEKLTSFFPQPAPPEGAFFRATYHPGAFGIRWISTLRPMTPNAEREK